MDLTNETDFNVTVDTDIKRFIPHPEYKRETIENDIALIELGTAVSFDKTFIRPACLQQSEFHGRSFIAVCKEVLGRSFRIKTIVYVPDWMEDNRVGG